jgi:hypothetical protein
MEEVEQEVVEEPKKPVKVLVRVISGAGQTSLVEWVDEEGMYHRAYVPTGKVEDGAVARKVLERGAPYGLPWEEFIEITATPGLIANRLRQRGMWRMEDLHPQKLMSCAKAFDVTRFMQLANKEASK